jgi:hypothetical protein
MAGGQGPCWVAAKRVLHLAFECPFTRYLINSH